LEQYWVPLGGALAPDPSLLAKIVEVLAQAESRSDAAAATHESLFIGYLLGV
jgi:hypothetical protein